MKQEIKFLGAAGTVTGSKFLLSAGDFHILIDCGLFQGVKELRLLNWKPFPFPPEKIDFILLTHGHLDHTGYLPRLVAEGFSGPILCTSPTAAIASIVLLDSARIQEEDAQRANEEKFSIHYPAIPLYNIKEAEKAISLFKDAKIDSWHSLSKDLKVRFRKNGHILGSAFIELDFCNKRIVFSGDIGREDDELLEKPETPVKADFLIMESTYGNRLHPKEDTDELLKDLILETLSKRGNLIIPCFAVERLQTVMYKLWKLYNQKKIPKIPVFIDSPMGNEVSRVFEQFPEWHKFSPKEYKQMQNHFSIISSYRDTWKTIDDLRPKIVVAGSGMLTGGRILTYLRYLIEQPETTVLLVGYQAEGTRGRLLQEGATELKIYGRYCPVKAEIKKIHGLSAHADQKELIDWLRNLTAPPKKIFLVHGEPTASDALRVKIKDRRNWEVEIPHLNDEVILE